MTTPVALLPKVRSSALMASIHGMPCALRVASFGGLPCAPQNTVVGCHIGGLNKGMSTKVSDLCVAAGCATCHDLVDGRDPRGMTLAHRYPGAWARQLMQGVFETQARLVEAGVIVVPGADIV